MPTKLTQAIEAAAIAAEELFRKDAQALQETDRNPKVWKTNAEAAKIVYAFFDEGENALYVGESGGRLKNRMSFQRSNHTKKPWWSKWTRIRFLPIKNRTDRIVLETLLILALAPPGNSKPGPRKFDEMFRDSN